MRVLAAAIVLGVALTCVLALQPRPAFACSGSPDILNDPDVIVGGRFTGWQAAPGQDTTAQQYLVDVRMSVERAYKGHVSGEIILVETLLFRRRMPDGSWGWMGGSAACGAFDTDPTGQYGVFGLTVQGDGTYRASSLLRLFIGPEPSGEAYNRAVARLAPMAPDVGNARLAAERGSGNDSAWWLLSLSAIAAPAFAFVTVGLAGLRRRRSISC
jgi:hypothetical protein